MEVLIDEEMKCVKCNEDIPPKRLEILPNTKTCVNCSTVGAYTARPIQYGTGDHTYTEIDIMTPEQAKKIQALLDQKKGKGKKMEWHGKDSDAHISKRNKPSKEPTTDK